MGETILQAHTCWACRASSRIGSSGSQGATLVSAVEIRILRPAWGLGGTGFPDEGCGESSGQECKFSLDAELWACGWSRGTPEVLPATSPTYLAAPRKLQASPSFLWCSSSALYWESLTLKSIYWRGNLELSDHCYRTLFHVILYIILFEVSV